MQQIEESKISDQNLKVKALLNETKLLNIAKLANMLVDLYGLEKQFQKIGERAGQEVELNIPSFKGSITFTLTDDRQKFNCRVEKVKHPVAKITLRVKEENTLKVLSKIIRSKANIFGLLKVAKLYIFRKVNIEGSYGAAIALCMILMIGKNNIYKKK